MLGFCVYCGVLNAGDWCLSDDVSLLDSRSGGICKLGGLEQSSGLGNPSEMAVLFLDDNDDMGP